MIGTVLGFSKGVSRRGFLQAAGLVGTTGFVAACAQAVVAPASPTAPAAGQGKAAWEQEWDGLVAAARQEGKVTLVTNNGKGYRDWIAAFEAAFPGVTVEHAQFNSVGSEFQPKFLGEREAGIYQWDVILTAANRAIRFMRPAGALDPIRPILIRPDILDDKSWRSGFDDGWIDKDKQWGYTVGELVSGLSVSTDLVMDGELKTPLDLLNPKWKGKMALVDVRSGYTNGPMGSVLRKYGEKVVRGILIDQEPVYSRDNRQVVEALIRGRAAIGSGVIRPLLKEFLEQGLGKNIKAIDIPDVTTLGVIDGVWLVNRAPHPNAAQLLINWMLTQQGQEAFSKGVGNNVRHLAVPPADPDLVPRPGQVYWNTGKENELDASIQAQNAIFAIMGITN